MAGLVTKGSGVNTDDHNHGTGGGHGLCNLTGMDIVHHAFHFLHGPTDVLRASTASRRWRELACADAVWRTKAVREGMVEKAGAFEVALPGRATAAVGGSGGGDSVGGDCDTSSTSSSSGSTEKQKDELAGVGLSFYAQIYVLKVPSVHFVLTICRLVLTLLCRSDHHHRSPSLSLSSAGIQDEGREPPRLPT